MALPGHVAGPVSLAQQALTVTHAPVVRTIALFDFLSRNIRIFRKRCPVSIDVSRLSNAVSAARSDPVYQAFLLLRTVFAVAPILFGLDKFANLLVRWPGYLAPWIDGIVPGTAQQAMYAVGVIEIVAGIAVAVAPRFGAWLVAAWLAGIIVNLLTFPGFFDIALRDFGLFVGAVALARLAARYAPGGARPRTA
jgi:uncharacterized membrane protein YphA (DoxX/SURF4 family)